MKGKDLPNELLTHTCNFCEPPPVNANDCLPGLCIGCLNARH